jgi:hypothetical protein
MAVRHLERHEDRQKQPKQADEHSTELAWMAHLVVYFRSGVVNNQT